MSRVNRMHREHRMQRSSSSMILGPKIHLLRFVHLGLHEPAGGLPVLEGVLLQLALARLIADRTIQRMIDQQRFNTASRVFRTVGVSV
jgi:hypothetical protein